MYTRLYLPTHITNHIKDMLWGSRNDWKAKFSKIIEVLPHSVANEEAKQYCSSCGEKERWPECTRCFYCADAEIINKYPYNTYSGENQGGFYLHNKYLLFSLSFFFRNRKFRSQYHYPNAARCWGTTHWRTRWRSCI